MRQRRDREPRRAGFTLLELMIVVVIMGVLAMIAIPAVVSYVYRARTTEAYTFLADIRARQESYRLERGRYAGEPASPIDWNPATFAPPGVVQSFDTTNAAWAQLGAVPDGPCRFRYRVIAGTPGAASGIPNLGGDFWYYAQAEADLDGDGVTMAIEAYSAQRQVYVSRGLGGPYLSEGWE